jgi:hypothetical protein
MTVLEVLTKVIRPEEFFGLVAFAKLVVVGEMVYSSVPVRLGVVGKLLATIAAGVAERAIGALGRHRC